MTTDSLFRDWTIDHSEPCSVTMPQFRSGSPPGGSTLMIRAPMSPRRRVQKGPAMSEPNSRTRSPSSWPPFRSIHLVNHLVDLHVHGVDNYPLSCPAEMDGGAFAADAFVAGVWRRDTAGGTEARRAPYNDQEVSA